MKKLLCIFGITAILFTFSLAVFADGPWGEPPTDNSIIITELPK